MRRVACCCCAPLLMAFWLAAPAWGEPAPVQVEGSGFTVESFDEGSQAFANRRYVLRGVPGKYRDWHFTQLAGGVTASLRVTARRNTALHVVALPAQKERGLKGWTAQPSGDLHYTDKGKTRLQIFSRELTAGQSLDIPQGHWAGSMVLAPEIEAILRKPQLDLSQVPGVVVDHQPATSGLYIGSPSIAVLPGGDYVASHDLFGPRATMNAVGVTRLFRSTDRGVTWTALPELQGTFWSTLFVHRGALYIVGTQKRFGDMVLRRSDDGGRTWTDPADENSGLLLKGPLHCGPQTVVVHNGRIWRAMESISRPFRFALSFRSLMVSAPEGADLLRAADWTKSNSLASDRSWLDGKFNGWLEGNAVVTPDGRIVNVLRVDLPRGGKAAIVRISPDGATATFDPQRDFIDFPGGAKKFTIRFDPVSKRYWSLTNYIPPKHAGPSAGGVRNTLALVSSPDLRRWQVNSIVLHHPDRAKHGFQYPDWLFDGDDLIAVVRTACNDGLGGAHSMHDANFLTFHRVKAFRKLSMKDSCVDPAELGLDDR